MGKEFWVVGGGGLIRLEDFWVKRKKRFFAKLCYLLRFSGQKTGGGTNWCFFRSQQTGLNANRGGGGLRGLVHRGGGGTHHKNRVKVVAKNTTFALCAQHSLKYVCGAEFRFHLHFSVNAQPGTIAYWLLVHLSSVQTETQNDVATIMQPFFHCSHTLSAIRSTLCGFA